MCSSVSVLVVRKFFSNGQYKFFPFLMLSLSQCSPLLQITLLYLKDLTLILPSFLFLPLLPFSLKRVRVGEVLKETGAWSLIPSGVLTHQKKEFQILDLQGIFKVIQQFSFLMFCLEKQFGPERILVFEVITTLGSTLCSVTY